MFRKPVEIAASIPMMSRKKAIILIATSSVLTAVVVKSIYDDKLRLERKANEILLTEGKNFKKNKKKDKKKKEKKLAKNLKKFKKGSYEL